MTSSPTTATSWFLWLTCSNPTSTFIIIERLRGSRSFFCATAKKQNSKKTKRQKDKKTKSQREEERKRQSDKKKKGQRQKPFNGSAMNSPPTPPYCGSVAAALHLMNSQCGSCREKGLFIALRWMQPDRGMMWQAENSELAREFPVGTASKARQSRLHQAQGFFPVFVFHSFNF